MNSKAFIIWLQGFLDASDDLTVEGVEFIKNKLKEVKDDLTDYVDIQPIPYQFKDYQFYNPCPMGGQHEYPDIWHSIIPPPCKKCGHSESQQIVTWSNTNDNPITNFMPDHLIQPFIPQGMSYIEFNLPVDSVISRTCNSEGGIDTMSIKVPVANQMTAEDYAFSTNGENIKIISDAIEKCWYDNQPQLRDVCLEVKVENDYWDEDQKFVEFEVELTDEERTLIGTDKRYARFKAPIKPVPECLKKPGVGDYMFDFKTTEGQDTYKELMERKIREASQHKYLKVMSRDNSNTSLRDSKEPTSSSFREFNDRIGR